MIAWQRVSPICHRFPWGVWAWETGSALPKCWAVGVPGRSEAVVVEPPRLLEVLVELEALLELLVKEEVASAEVVSRPWGSAWPPQESLQFAVSPVAAAAVR